MEIKQITTGYRNERIFKEENLVVARFDHGQELFLLNIYPHLKYQAIDFFGGAITDAVAATLEKMPKDCAQAVIDSYFGKKGIGYQAIRTHIDSCDFATSAYAAVKDPLDTNFNSFSIQRDIDRIIYWIKEAYKSAGRILPVMLSPWSPPDFMKTNHSRIQGGYLKKEYYESWARYICKYVHEYRKSGVDVQMLSIQNEPNAVQKWDSCLFTAEQEKIFLADYLYPCMLKNKLDDIKIYIWDHNKERLFDRVESVVTDQTAEMITGAAFHWYSGDHFAALRLVREQFPKMKLLFSEGCIEYSRFDKNQFKNAQIYGHDMIGNFSAGMNAFLDWNICLDENGGPNYADNYCAAPVICDTVNSKVDYQLSYHYISHFSRFIQPGAKRIATTVYTREVEQVAFQNPDQSIVLITFNETEKELPLTIRLSDHLYESIIPRQSISTFIIGK
ncbi:glucosylceramidase [Clostridiales bacterium COT073_COT-073]|nr:glucosylceramidase [Clostridiales bacterium COT073_COT-073]